MSTDPVPEPPSPIPPPPAVVIPRARLVVIALSAFKERDDAEPWQFAFGSYPVLWCEVYNAPSAEGPLATFRRPVVHHEPSGLLVGIDELERDHPGNLYWLVRADWPKCDDEWKFAEIRESLKPLAIEVAESQRRLSLTRLTEARELLSGQRTRLTREPPSLPPRLRCGADELEVEPPYPPPHQPHHPIPLHHEGARLT
jgi:hypothetical protein